MAEYLGSLTIKLTEFQETQIPRAKGKHQVFGTGSLNLQDFGNFLQPGKHL